MNSEPKVAAIWARPRIIIFCLTCLTVGFAFACLIVLHSAEKRLAEEHTARMEAEAENREAAKLVERAKDLLETETAQLESCQKSAQKNLSDSVARLQTKTLLVTSLPAAPQSPTLLPEMQRLGMLGLLMEVVQASQKQGGHATPPAQVWVIPTTVEPMFAGDAQRAWVIHADLQTGRSVDTPHHPLPMIAAVK